MVSQGEVGLGVKETKEEIVRSDSQGDVGHVIKEMKDEVMLGSPVVRSPLRPKTSENAPQLCVANSAIGIDEDPFKISRSMAKEYEAVHKDIEEEIRQQEAKAERLQAQEKYQHELGEWVQAVLFKSGLFASFVAEQIVGNNERLSMEKTKTPAPEAKGPPKKRGRPSKRKAEDADASGQAAKQSRTDASLLPEAPLAPQPDVKDQPILLSGGTLRPYQQAGYMWLRSLIASDVNGILADEMGLGKTIQTIAAICYLAENARSHPCIVIAPLSTLPNWGLEFARFAPELHVIIYHGDQKHRATLQKDVSRQFYAPSLGTKIPAVVLTTYEIAIRDRKFLGPVNWNYLVIDEGHRIKNMHCYLVRALKKYVTRNRVILTGTPLQNNLSELWSLLNFLLPTVFDNIDKFEGFFDFDKIILSRTADCHERVIQEDKRKQMLSKLHQILTPFLLRRVKTDVELDLPPKREVLVYAQMTPLQQKYYLAALDRSLERLCTVRKEEEQAAEEECQTTSTGRQRRSTAQPTDYAAFAINDDDDGDEAVEEWAAQLVEKQDNEERLRLERYKKRNLHLFKRSIPLRSLWTVMRKAVNHPYLLEYPLVTDEDGEQQYRVDEEVVLQAGKMRLLDAMLSRLKQGGHRVLLFSQWTSLLDIIEDYLNLRGYEYRRLDGTTKIADRQERIAAFNSDDSIFIFLLTTRAGGLGINLTGADTVIIYDSDLNPQQDLQAQDRCHRIGQKRSVIIYRLVTRNSVDEHIFKRATSKRRLEKLVMHKGKFNSLDEIVQSGSKSESVVFSVDELRCLMQQCDHSAVVDGDVDVIDESMLEQLMDREKLIALSSTLAATASETVAVDSPKMKTVAFDVV